MSESQTALDAVADVLVDSPNWGSDEWALDLLSALGIPPGASVEDVKAGLALLRLVASDHDLHVWAMMGGGFVVQAEPPVGRTISAAGPSPAAAVLALAAKVEEGRDA